MATPEASDLLSDGEKSFKALKLGMKLLEIGKTLTKDIEEIRTVSRKAEEIKDTSNATLAEFRDLMKNLSEKGNELEESCVALKESEVKMNRALNLTIKSKRKTPQLVKDCLKELQNLLDAGKDFGVGYEDFRKYLDEVIEKCNTLINELTQLKERAESEASNIRRADSDAAKKYGVAAGAAVALGVASFFTFGATLGPAAALAGTFGGGVLAHKAVTQGTDNALHVQELDEKAKTLEDLIRSLRSCLNQLDKVANSTDENIEITEQLWDALTDMINMYQERHRVLELEAKLNRSRKCTIS